MSFCIFRQVSYPRKSSLLTFGNEKKNWKNVPEKSRPHNDSATIFSNPISLPPISPWRIEYKRILTRDGDRAPPDDDSTNTKPATANASLEQNTFVKQNTHTLTVILKPKYSKLIAVEIAKVLESKLCSTHFFYERKILNSDKGNVSLKYYTKYFLAFNFFIFFFGN